LIRVNKKQIKTPIFLILVALTGLLAFTMLHRHYGGSFFPTLPNERQAQYLSQELLYKSTHDFEILDDGVIQATSHDPWIFVKLDPNVQGHVLHIHISGLSEPETFAQVFYAPYAGGFSEAESINFLLRDGVNTLVLPRSNNASLRLDLTSRQDVSMIVDKVILANYLELSGQFWAIYSVALLLIVGLLYVLFFKADFVMFVLRKFIPQAAENTLVNTYDRSLRRIRKLNLFIVLLSTLVLRLLPLMRTLVISTAPEEVGSLFIAVRLAGLNWLYIGHSFTYPGQVYNAIFAPLFMLTDNPFTIYLTILLFNAILVTLFSVIIYAIAVIYCKLPDRYPTALIAAFCSGTLFTGNAWLLSNEIPTFIIVWLTALMLFISANLQPGSAKTKRVLVTLGLTVVLFAGMVMQQRLETLFVVTSVLALLYFLAYKTWVIIPGVFYPVSALFFVVARSINLILTREIVADMGFTEIVGIIMAPTGLFQQGFSSWTALDIFITNITALFVHTHGLAVMTTIIFAILFCRVIKRLIFKHMRDDEKTGMLRNQLVVMFVFTSALTGELFTVSSDIRGAVSPLFGPLLLLTFSFIYSNMKIVQQKDLSETNESIPQGNTEKFVNMSFVAIGVFAVTYFCVIFQLIPTAPGYLKYSYIFSETILLRLFRGGIHDVFATFAVTIAFFAAFNFAIRKQKPIMIIIPIYALLLSVTASFISTPFFNVVVPGGRIDSTYNELMNIEENSELPYIIYVSDNITGLYLLQFMLNRHTLGIGIPDIDNEDSIYIGAHFSDNANSLREIGFAPYFFSNNAGIWIRGEGIRKSLAENTAEHDLEFDRVDPRIAYLIEAGGAENIYISNSVFEQDDIWVYQSIFYNKTVNPFNNKKALFNQNMENNVVFAHVDDDVFLFSQRAFLNELMIVTDNIKIITAVVALGGKIDSDHVSDSLFFESDRPWLAPGEGRLSPAFSLSVGHYEVTIIGNNLANAGFQVWYAYIESDSVEFDSIFVSDYFVTFTFTLYFDADSTQVITSNDGLGFVWVDSIKLRIMD